MTTELLHNKYNTSSKLRTTQFSYLIYATAPSDRYLNVTQRRE